MVAPRKIRCLVIEVPSEMAAMSPRTRARFRPSQLVPWADPYIASLVHKLQNEVRHERRGGCAALARTRERLDLDVPWNDEAFEFEPAEEDAPLDFGPWPNENEFN
jgi:hypothetical protein